jgi:hypothetical protein
VPSANSRQYLATNNAVDRSVTDHQDLVVEGELEEFLSVHVARDLQC